MRFIFTACFIISTLITVQVARAGQATMAQDGIGVTLKGEDGYSITVDGVPFSPVSFLFVVDPQWHNRYYGYGDDSHREAVVANEPANTSLITQLRSDNFDVVRGTQTLELLPDRRLRIAADIRVTSDTPAVLENRIASIDEAWLTNAPWSAVTADGQTTHGTTPRWAPSDAVSESTIISNFRKATFQTPRGPLTIETTGSATIALVDYRSNQYAQGERYYWFGVLGSRLPATGTLNYAVTLQFPKPIVNQTPAVAENNVDIYTSQTVIQPTASTDRIVPTPKQIAWEKGVLPVEEQIGVFIKTKHRWDKANETGIRHDGKWDASHLFLDSGGLKMKCRNRNDLYSNFYNRIFSFFRTESPSIYQPWATPKVTKPFFQALNWCPITPANTGGTDFSDTELKRVVADMSNRFKRKFGIDLQIVPNRKNATIIVELSRSSMDMKPEQAAEAYALTIGDKIKIDMIHGPAGLRNALFTLEQLIRYDVDSQPGFRKVDIFDYPSLMFRGIHFFTGKGARDLQEKMVSEILAPLKINKLVYQVDYIKWDSAPLSHSEVYGMEKSAAKAVADTAKALGIDVIPLVNTFGHSEWLLENQAMRKYADDPADPFAYDPSNPEVYRICENIYREAIELFHPSIIHIGHDEVADEGFPKKPANKKVGGTRLLIDDILHYHAFLKKLGIRTMMWGDTLLAPGEAPDATTAPDVTEAQRRRGLLPKDMIIADWHYKTTPPEEYKSLKAFNDAGFDTVASTWATPGNIVNFAKAANHDNQSSKSLGLLQTTWAGYSFDQQSLTDNLDQYAAYVLAAEAAWTGGKVDLENPVFDYKQEFQRLWNDDDTGRHTETGWTCNLDPAANVQLSAAALSLKDNALSSLKPGTVKLGKYSFHIAGKDGKLAAIQMAGAWNHDQKQPTRQRLVLNPNPKSGAAITSSDPSSASVETKEIFIAMATPHAAPEGAHVGTATFEMDNGSTRSIELDYGKNITSLSDDRQILQAPTVWKSPDIPAGKGAAVIHVLKWINPNPKQKVGAIQFNTKQDGPGLLLLGISGI